MRRIDHYSPDPELNQKLKQLEENVLNEFGDQPEPNKLRIVRVRSAGTIVQPGDLALIDISSGTADVLLATPVVPFEGKMLMIVVRQGSVTIRPVSAKINGGASIGLASLNSVRIFCADGQYYT